MSTLLPVIFGRFFEIAHMSLLRYLLTMIRTVVFYETEGGARPAEKFVRGLDLRTRAKITAAIDAIQNNPSVSPVLFCKMPGTDSLWEIRVKHNTNIYRLLCFFDGAALIVAAHGFQKKDQKTPLHEIKTAETRKKDYFRRK